MQRLLDADAAADMVARENSGFSVHASVRIALIDRDVPSYFQGVEHLLRYCARPPFALERLSVRRGEDGRIATVRSVLPRHKAANWVGPGRGRKSTRPARHVAVEEMVPAAPSPPRWLVAQPIRRLDLIAAEPATAAHDDHGVSLDTPQDKQGDPACCRGPSVEPGAGGGDGTGDGRTDEPISGMVSFRTIRQVGATRFERATSTSRT